MNTIQFNLTSPLPYLNSKIEKGTFDLVYPKGNAYWQLLDERGNRAMDGSYIFSQEVISQWTDSDDVLIEDLLAAEPWIVKPVEMPKVEEVNEVINEETNN